MTVLASITTP